MKSGYAKNGHLSSHVEVPHSRIAVLGEVLWDLYDHSRHLGGAALNFGAHARRLCHEVSLISAVGVDELGNEAAEIVSSLGLDTRFFHATSRFPTGVAQLRKGPDERTSFAIARPAAYDAVILSPGDLEQLKQQRPEWLYYGTLFASTPPGKEVLCQLLALLDTSLKFYDLNLRPGSDSPDLVRELLQHADVVKLNEEELEQVHAFTGLPAEAEAFCRQGAARYGWRAAGITLGDRGCAILANNQYVETPGHPVDVVDTVGAGDAFAAAFLHGLSLNWPAPKIASFANRVGALVATRHGAIPAWTIEEAVSL